METQFKLFENIWMNYFTLLPMKAYEYDGFLNIIEKIKQNEYDFLQDKVNFIDLTLIMSHVIYHHKYTNEQYTNNNYNEQYDDTNYEQYDVNNNYEHDKELNCCYIIREYLKMIVQPKPIKYQHRIVR